MTDPVSPETATAEPLDALIDRAITAWNCDGPDGPPALGAFIAWWLNEKGWEIRRAGSAVPAQPATAEPTEARVSWWACPNEPPCPHGGLVHDIEDWEDTSPTCCVEGCACPSRADPPDLRARLAAELARIELRPVLVSGRYIVLAEAMADALLPFVQAEIGWPPPPRRARRINGEGPIKQVIERGEELS